MRLREDERLAGGVMRENRRRDRDSSRCQCGDCPQTELGCQRPEVQAGSGLGRHRPESNACYDMFAGPRWRRTLRTGHPESIRGGAAVTVAPTGRKGCVADLGSQGPSKTST